MLGEVVCITMLVGFSVDYTVHLCDSYIHNGVANASSHMDGIMAYLDTDNDRTTAPEYDNENQPVEIDMAQLAQEGPPSYPSHPSPKSHSNRSSWLFSSPVGAIF